MKPSEAIELDRKREGSDTWNKIYLHRDGNFYHAYEWSAWLIKTIVCTEEFQKERKDSTILASTRFIGKSDIGEYVIVGFPLQSLSKYIPTYKDVSPKEDGDITIEVEISDIENKSYDDLNKKYQAWKDACPLKEPKQKEAKPKSSISIVQKQSAGLFSIASQVLSYPLESSSAQDNINFIASLRQQIARLL